MIWQYPDLFLINRSKNCKCVNKNKNQHVRNRFNEPQKSHPQNG
jgi:hypothetical protein